MKAVRLFEYGGQLVFNDVPTPTIARDEILVKVKSTAVNHIDLVKASGAVRQILPIDLPWIPGHEFSGVVEQIGSDVAAYAPGDAVFAANLTGGAYAEYLTVKPAVIAKKPSNLSFEEAASVPVAAQTAWQGLFTHGRSHPAVFRSAPRAQAQQIWSHPWQNCPAGQQRRRNLRKETVMIAQWNFSLWFALLSPVIGILLGILGVFLLYH